MYKDKDKQREANRLAQAKFKAKAKAKSITGQGITLEPNVSKVIPKRGKDIKYQMTVMERLFYRPASKLKPGETNFVSLPGRACYG